MVNFIQSIFDFWQSVLEAINEGFGLYYNQSNLFNEPLSLWGINTCISDILLLGLSIATFGLLVYFSFKIVKYCFRFFGNLFGGWWL